MKTLFSVAIAIVFMSCSGNTSSDKYIDKNAKDSSNAMKADSAKPKDTVYPSSDTNSYRKATAKPADTTK